MVGRIVKIDRLHALDLFEVIEHVLRVLVGDVRHHDLSRAVGGKLPVHDVQRLFRLGILRQIERQIIFNLDPVAGKHGENDKNDGNQEK